MPAASPAGSISLVTEAFRTTVANCTTFQTWTSTADATAALAKLHLYFADASATRPLAWIDNGDQFEGRREGYGCSTHSGTLMLAFEMAHNDAVDDADAKRLFVNAVGQVCDEALMKRQTTPSITGPALESWRFFARPMLVAEGATEDSATPATPSLYWFAMIEFTFGPGA